MTQWNRLLLNLGAWEGSFTQLSPTGELREDSPSVVTLEGLNDNKTVRQTIVKVRNGDRSEQVLEYSSLSRSVHFFETGAFSQGSLQLGPFSTFGAELGFIDGDRRLRLVQLFDKQAQLSQITLIRESLAGSDAQPQLTVEGLLGTWQGKATTHYADLRSPDKFGTSLQLSRQGNRVTQALTIPGRTLTSEATVEGSSLRFEGSGGVVQVLLLPGGASSTTPLELPKRQAFFLEAGWLMSPTRRQRMIRRYSESGAWETLTLVEEEKQV
ncbi:MAG: DUF3598 family protein [Cyanobacteria bacterium P01_A01_bin.135]